MATGDRAYIADKETLDAVNAKAGTTSDPGGTASTGSIFAKLNALINSFATHVAAWTADRAAKMDNLDAAVSTRASEANAITRYNTLNANTRVNNMASASGTLSQKLSYAITQLDNVNANAINGSKQLVSKQSRPAINTTGRITLLNVTGAGEFELMWAPEGLRNTYVNAFYVTVDGVAYTIGTAAYTIYLGRRSDPANFPCVAITDVEYEQWKAYLKPLRFGKSLKIEANVVTVPSNTGCIIDYALYE